MTAAQLSTLQRFELITDGLCAALGSRYPAAGAKAPAGPLLLLVWTWLRRGAARVSFWARRLEAGTAPASRPANPRAAARPSDAPPAPRSKPPSALRLPCGRGWLVRLAPAVGVYAAQLRHLLADGEMRALLEASPQIGRVLRPLCRALLIEPDALPACARARLVPPPGVAAPAEAERGAPLLPTSSYKGSRGVSVLGYVLGRRRRPPPLAGGRGG